MHNPFETGIPDYIQVVIVLVIWIAFYLTFSIAMNSESNNPTLKSMEKNGHEDHQN